MKQKRQISHHRLMDITYILRKLYVFANDQIKGKMNFHVGYIVLGKLRLDFLIKRSGSVRSTLHDGDEL